MSTKIPSLRISKEIRIPSAVEVAVSTTTQPTAAELDTALGAANRATSPDGAYMAVVVESSTGEALLVTGIGNVWHYQSLTAAS